MHELRERPQRTLGRRHHQGIESTRLELVRTRADGKPDLAVFAGEQHGVECRLANLGPEDWLEDGRQRKRKPRHGPRGGLGRVAQRQGQDVGVLSGRKAEPGFRRVHLDELVRKIRGAAIPAVLDVRPGLFAELARLALEDAYLVAEGALGLGPEALEQAEVTAFEVARLLRDKQCIAHAQGGDQPQQQDQPGDPKTRQRAERQAHGSSAPSKEAVLTGTSPVRVMNRTGTGCRLQATGWSRTLARTSAPHRGTRTLAPAPWHPHPGTVHPGHLAPAVPPTSTACT